LRCPEGRNPKSAVSASLAWRRRWWFAQQLLDSLNHVVDHFFLVGVNIGVVDQLIQRLEGLLVHTVPNALNGFTDILLDIRAGPFKCTLELREVYFDTVDLGNSWSFHILLAAGHRQTK